MMVALAPGPSEASGRAIPPVSRVCPSHASTMIRANPWPPASQKLAPTGAVAISLCRYADANTPPRLGIVGNVLVERYRQVDWLIREFDALRAVPPGAFVCPFDAGEALLATVFYPHKHKVTIRVDLQGCNPVTNGDLVRTAANLNGVNPQGPHLLAKLKRLTDRLRIYHRARHYPAPAPRAA